MAPSSKPPRQARAIETRRRLLEATVECLVVRGYAATTTAAVCESAGVSQGALFKHFPSKASLLAATIEHLFGDLIRDVRRVFETAAEEDDRIGSAVRLLDRTFHEPRLLASFELYVAARTDRDLAAALQPAAASYREALRQEAKALFGLADDENPDRDALVQLVLSAMQGRALSSLAGGDPRGEVGELVALYRLASRELGGASQPAP